MEWRLEIGAKYEHKGEDITPLYWWPVAGFSVAYSIPTTFLL